MRKKSNFVYFFVAITSIFLILFFAFSPKMGVYFSFFQKSTLNDGKIFDQLNFELLGDDGSSGSYEELLLSPNASAPVIEGVDREFVSNEIENVITITGRNFDSSAVPYLNGVAYEQYDYISSTQIEITLPLEFSLGEYAITVVNPVDQFSNPWPLIVGGIGLDSVAPTILQVTPVGMENLYNLELVPVFIYGYNFESSSRVFVDETDLTSSICPISVCGPITSGLIIILLTKSQLTSVQNFKVVNSLEASSNIFNVRHTTHRYPEILTISENVIEQNTVLLNLKGYNFFPTNSILYVDDIEIDPTNYNLNYDLQDNTFSIDILLEGLNLEIGTHFVYLDNPPRFPSISYGRFISNKLFFEIVESKKDLIYLANSKVELSFDGDTGSLENIKNLETGRDYKIKNSFPWRVVPRKILNPNSLIEGINPISRAPYFNPFIGECISTLTNNLVSVGESQRLDLVWSNCKLDESNSFNFVQSYLLASDKTYAEMTFAIDGSGVSDYGLYSVRQYLTLEDNPLVEEYGLLSERTIENAIEPFYNIPSLGTRDICHSQAGVMDRFCAPDEGVGGDTVNVREGFYSTDGDGYAIYYNAWTDLWTALWDEDGEYFYAYPDDSMESVKGYNYQGQLGQFKTTSVIQVANSFRRESFTYQSPFAYRLGVGKTDNYQGKEAWIDLADIFADMQRENGYLNSPIAEQNLPPLIKELDLGSGANLYGEFFDSSGGLLHNRGSNMEVIAGAYEEAREFYGAEKSFLFVYVGDQDRREGLRYRPVPEIEGTTQGGTLSSFAKLNEAGWAPCYYTVAGGFEMYTDEPEYLPEDTMEYDPTGYRITFPSNGHNLAFMDPLSSATGEGVRSYLQWLLNKYRIMNNGGTGAKCFYSDGIFAPLWLFNGPWSQKFGHQGFDDEVTHDLDNFYNKLSEEIKNIDVDSFTSHEGFTQLFALRGSSPIQAVPGSVGKDMWAMIDPSAYRHDVHFGMRVYGGYQKFGQSNGMVLTDLPSQRVHILPEWYSLLKSTGALPSSYDRPLEEAYLLPGMVGAIIFGGVPWVVESGISKANDYTPLFRMGSSTPILNQDFWNSWKGTLEEYAYLNKDLVAFHQLARDYFDGLWHPSLITNSLEEEYYYIQSGARLLANKPYSLSKVTYPRVISVVRQKYDSILENWGEQYGLIFMNTYSGSETQEVNFDFSFNRYGLNVGTNYDLFRTTKEDGRVYLGTYSNDFSYSLTVLKRKTVLLELVPQGDDDADGVLNRNDRCPETEINVNVNINDGCPVPLASSFSSELSTNFENVLDLHNVDNLVLGRDGKGVIDFSGNSLDLLRFLNGPGTFESIDLDSGIVIDTNIVSVDTTILSELDVPARVTLFGLTFVNPTVLRDGLACPNCLAVSYNSGNFVFNVDGFSEYTVIEGTCGDSFCSASESCSTCSLDCGACPSGSTSGSGAGSSGAGGGGGSGGGSSGGSGSFVTQCSDRIDNDGDNLMDYPYDLGCLNEQDNSEIDGVLNDTEIGDDGINDMPDFEDEGEVIEDLNVGIVFWTVLVLIVFAIIIVGVLIMKLISRHKHYNYLAQ